MMALNPPAALLNYAGGVGLAPCSREKRRTNTMLKLGIQLWRLRHSKPALLLSRDVLDAATAADAAAAATAATLLL
jgi:hypothetical protein